MDKALNREVLRLSLPSILANLTVPLVGMVDTAIAGHLTSGDGTGAATFIGAISVGGMLFSLLYWNFSFLRTGTGGLTAQAFGRGDMHGCASIFARGMVLSLGIAAILLLLQWPFAKVLLSILNATPEVEALAEDYFFTRIWAAPATVSLMMFGGWFVGMQDSVSSMWKDLTVNIVNVIASLVLALGLGPVKGMGFAGIALGTVIAQYAGMAYCLVTCSVKYGRKVFSTFRRQELRGLLRGRDFGAYMKMNADLLGRSIGFTAIYIGFTMIAAGFGDVLLACSSIMMQILMIFSYFTDGFAYAGEALTGRFIGERNRPMMEKTVKYVFVWSLAIAVVFIGIYWAGGVPLLRLLTSDSVVIDTCRRFLPWLIIMPPLGCLAFTWDGIYLGATASRQIRNAMLGAAVGFFLVWFGGEKLLSSEGEASLHLLMAAYFTHLTFRTVYLSCTYRGMKNALFL